MFRPSRTREQGGSRGERALRKGANSTIRGGFRSDFKTRISYFPAIPNDHASGLVDPWLWGRAFKRGYRDAGQASGRIAGSPALTGPGTSSHRRSAFRRRTASYDGGLRSIFQSGSPKSPDMRKPGTRHGAGAGAPCVHLIVTHWTRLGSSRWIRSTIQRGASRRPVLLNLADNWNYVN